MWLWRRYWSLTLVSSCIILDQIHLGDNYELLSPKRALFCLFKSYNWLAIATESDQRPTAPNIWKSDRKKSFTETRMSCCPPESLGQLGQDGYKPRGTIVTRHTPLVFRSFSPIASQITCQACMPSTMVRGPWLLDIPTITITMVHHHHQGGSAHLCGGLRLQMHHVELRHFWIRLRQNQTAVWHCCWRRYI